MEVVLFLLIIGIPQIIIAIDFIGFLINGTHLVNEVLLKILDILIIVVIPIIGIMVFDSGHENNCCDKTILFSPHHRLTIYIVVILSIAAYFYSSYRRQIAPPVLEIITNAFLIIGIILNVLIAIQLNESWLWVLGNLPIILLFILRLVKNQKILNEYLENNIVESKNAFISIIWTIIKFHPIIKLPIFLILSAPLFVLLGCLLLVFAQKPDSILLAFTQTDHLGFSQLNAVCDNVNCGGHYLCSVAAKGHKRIVKPQRLGTRNGNLIICNRQLLVSNAFEQLLEERFPHAHNFIRKNYDLVGDIVHRYYYLFNIRLVSDVVYIAMKPLEWCFLLVLYTFDRNPEIRISKQYLEKKNMAAAAIL